MKSARLVVKYLLIALCLTPGLYGQALANDHAVVLDERGHPVLTELSGTCVRTRWLEDRDICRASLTEMEYQKKQAAISQDERTVYFPFNLASLTPDAMSRLDTLSTDIKAQKVKGARVVGFADRIGTPSYNEALSKKRAENVKNYLIAKGIVNARVAETRWFGASMPATSCPADMPRPALIDCLQKDRRVEVEIDYAPEVVASR